MTMAQTDPATHAQNTIEQLAADLLDAFYGEHQTANAYGCDYEAPGTDPDGTYFLGRDDGPDGSGVDYIMRRFPDPENRREDESEYVYGRYGWMDADDLLDEAPLLRQVFADAAEQDFLDEDALDTFDTAIDGLVGNLQSFRQQFDLDDIVDLFQAHDIDTLRDLLAHGDEEGRVVWQLLFSKDEEGDHIENPIDIPVVSEAHQVMLITTERYFYDEDTGEGKHYDYGAVVGYDDTPQRFFVHRLDSSALDLGPEWTPELVKEAMGFDANLHEVDPSDLPYGRIIRVQGDLAVVRHDFDAAVEDTAESNLQSLQYQMARDHVEAFREAHPEYDESDRLRLRRRPNPPVSAHNTDDIKELQDALGISEEEVRDRQPDDWAQLTAGRRQELVEDIISDCIVEFAYEQADATRTEHRQQAHEEAVATFSDTDDQSNNFVGNHTVIVGDAVANPDLGRFGGEETRAVYAVPEESTCFVVHDEHDDKHLSLGTGVYTLRFLDGFETEWWQDSA